MLAACLLVFSLIAIGYCGGRMHSDHLLGIRPLPWRDDVQPAWQSNILGFEYRLYEFQCGHSVSVALSFLGRWEVRAWSPGVHGPVYDSVIHGGTGTIRGEHGALTARGLPSPWKWKK